MDFKFTELELSAFIFSIILLYFFSAFVQILALVILVPFWYLYSMRHNERLSVILVIVPSFFVYLFCAVLMNAVLTDGKYIFGFYDLIHSTAFVLLNMGILYLDDYIDDRVMLWDDRVEFFLRFMIMASLYSFLSVLAIYSGTIY